MEKTPRLPIKFPKICWEAVFGIMLICTIGGGFGYMIYSMVNEPSYGLCTTICEEILDGEFIERDSGDCICMKDSKMLRADPDEYVP